MPADFGIARNGEATGLPQPRHYDTHGGSPPENYERHFVPVIGAPLAHDLVAIAALRPGERVLDVACGTGIVARLASERVGPTGTVAGLDVNSGMLAVARSTTPPDAVIHWHEASAEAMPQRDASFDAVLCQMGLQFVPDKHAALSGMWRVLAPGGRLVLSVPGPMPRVFAIMREALARHVGVEVAGFVDQVFSLHETEELANLLNGAGFRDVVVHADTTSLRLPPPEQFLWQYVHSTPLAKAAAQLSADRRDLLERDCAAAWQEYVRDRALMLHLRMVTVTARK